MTPTPPSEGFRDLIQRAARGDRGAMDAAITRVRPHLEGLMHAYGGPGDDPSDLLKKVSRMAWRRRRKVPAAEDDAEAFSRFRDWLGKFVYTLGRRRRMSACIDGLEDPTARAIVRLRFFQGFSLKSIARRLDRSPEEIRRGYRSAMRELEQLFYRGPDLPAEKRVDPALEDRVHRVAELFWEALHAGEEPDREGYARQYPDLGDLLRIRLGIIQRMYENRPARETTPPRHRGAPPDFRAILSAVKEGDEKARESFASILLPEIQRLSTEHAIPARYLQTDEDELERKVSDQAFLTLASLLEGETDEEAFTSFRLWLRDIVRQVTARLERDHARLPWGPAGVRTPRERIRDAFSRLPDQVDASILWLHLFDGVSLSQIAERLDQDYRRVRERYRRAIRFLQEELEPIL